MSIKHRKGRKMYCADSLSRWRPVEEDDKEPVFVESGQLFKLHVPIKGGEVTETLLQFLQDQTEKGPTYHNGTS